MISSRNFREHSSVVSSRTSTGVPLDIFSKDSHGMSFEVSPEIFVGVSFWTIPYKIPSGDAPGIFLQNFSGFILNFRGIFSRDPDWDFCRSFC